MLWRELADAQENGALGRQQAVDKVVENAPKQRKMLQRRVHNWPFCSVLFCLPFIHRRVNGSERCTFIKATSISFPLKIQNAKKN